jgi:histidinol-phosphatase (PHP family)
VSALTADAHVHSEWSWDAGSDPASAGTMRRTCEQAVRIGLPALVFTEHLDFEDSWYARDGDIGEHAQKHLEPSGRVRVPPFDADGYLASIDECRHAFPELRILTGVEFGQPHLWDDRASELLSSGLIERVNGSLHTLPLADGTRTEPTTLYRDRAPADVVWAYLEEVPRMVRGSDSFAVFTHIDYAIRSWPVHEVGPFDPSAFEEGFRGAMREIAEADRALEMNTRRLWPWIPQWWAQEGGRAVTFGSDSHHPSTLASNFYEAMAMLEAVGFAPGSRPWEFWTR